MEHQKLRHVSGTAIKPARRTIYLNARFLTQPLSGMQRYAEELISALDARIVADSGYLGGVRLVGLLPPVPARMPGWRTIEMRRVGRLKGHAWEQIELARAAGDGVLVSLSGSGPIAHPRHVFAVHDANVHVNPQFYSWPYRTWHGFLRPRLARRASALLTISDFSRGELARWFGLPESRFEIVPDSAEHMLDVTPDTEVLNRNGLIPGRYALCVGNQSPNKNIALAVEAFAELVSADMRLAVAGGSSAALAEARIVDVPWLSALGRVSDGELRALYENAAVFVFSSLYEGFGVPPLEAMTLGCPVVSSDSSAMPEVLGNAALFFPSGNAKACAARIREVLSWSAEERQRAVDTGRTQAARYRWKNSAETLGATLRTLVGS